MTDHVTLQLPNGSERLYKEGQRVRILHGCPQLPSKLPDGGKGIITTVLDTEVVVKLDDWPEVLNPIPAQSMYLEPL